MAAHVGMARRVKVWEAGMGQKIDRSGGRELWRQRASRLSPVGRKSSPERLTLLLDYMAQFPGVMRAVAFSGMSYSNFKYILQRSMEGQPGDGYDLTYGDSGEDGKGVTKRFHQHFEEVRDGAVQRVEDSYMQRAMVGYYEVLS